MKININKILFYTIISLLFIICFCSVTAFVAGKANFRNYRKSDPKDIATLSKTTDATNSFKELGTIRAITKPEEGFAKGVVVVISPWFSYNETDPSFIEELSSKKQTIKTIFLNYFSSSTKNELFSKGENSIKQELLQAINQNLVMGKILGIFFDDYIFLD